MITMPPFCLKCDRCFAKKHNLIRHDRLVHFPWYFSAHVCEFCQLGFESPGRLSGHRTRSSHQKAVSAVRSKGILPESAKVRRELFILNNLWNLKNPEIRKLKMWSRKSPITSGSDEYTGLLDPITSADITDVLTTVAAEVECVADSNPMEIRPPSPSYSDISQPTSPVTRIQVSDSSSQSTEEETSQALFQILPNPPQFINDCCEPSPKRMRLGTDDWMEKMEIRISHLENKIDSVVTKADQLISKVDNINVVSQGQHTNVLNTLNKNTTDTVTYMKDLAAISQNDLLTFIDTFRKSSQTQISKGMLNSINSLVTETTKCLQHKN